MRTNINHITCAYCGCLRRPAGRDRNDDPFCAPCGVALLKVSWELLGLKTPEKNQSVQVPSAVSHNPSEVRSR